MRFEKGQRVKIKRPDQPDMVVIVDEVELGATENEVRLSVHREDVPPIDPELWRLYRGDTP